MYYTLYDPKADLIYALRLYPEKRLAFQSAIAPIPMRIAIACHLINHYHGKIVDSVINPLSLGFNNRIAYEMVQVPEKVINPSLGIGSYHECSMVELALGDGEIFRMGQLLGNWAFLTFIDDDCNRHWFHLVLNFSGNFYQWMPFNEMASFSPLYLETLEF